MISSCTSSIPDDDVVLAILLYCHSRYTMTCPLCSLVCYRPSIASHLRSQVLPGVPEALSGAPGYSQTYHNHSHNAQSQ